MTSSNIYYVEPSESGDFSNINGSVFCLALGDTEMVITSICLSNCVNFVVFRCSISKNYQSVIETAADLLSK